MALETISGGAMKSLSTLQQGESISGFLKGVVKERNKFDSEQWNFVMLDKNGDEFKVLTGGTAKYFAANVASAMGLAPVDPAFSTAVEAAKKTLGKWIVITLEGSYQNTRKQTVKKFQIQMDPEKVLGAPQEDVNGNVAAEDIPF